MSLIAKANAATSLREKAQRAAACGQYETAAVSWMKAGKLFSESGSYLEAEQAWRRACDFCERTADQIAQRPTFDA